MSPVVTAYMLSVVLERGPKALAAFCRMYQKSWIQEDQLADLMSRVDVDLHQVDEAYIQLLEAPKLTRVQVLDRINSTILREEEDRVKADWLLISAKLEDFLCHQPDRLSEFYEQISTIRDLLGSPEVLIGCGSFPEFLNGKEVDRSPLEVLVRALRISSELC